MTRDFSSSFYFSSLLVGLCCICKRKLINNGKEGEKGGQRWGPFILFCCHSISSDQDLLKILTWCREEKAADATKKWKKIPLNKNVPGIELGTFLNDFIALLVEQA